MKDTDNSSGTGGEQGGSPENRPEKPLEPPRPPALGRARAKAAREAAAAGAPREGDGAEDASEGGAAQQGAGEGRIGARGTLIWIPLERIDVDPHFRVRGEEADVGPLATCIAKLGQLFPVEVRPQPPDRYQLIAGFRRLAALGLLKRDQVLARVHEGLSDEDAFLMALADGLYRQPVGSEELSALKRGWAAEGRLSPAVGSLIDGAPAAAVPRAEDQAPQAGAGKQADEEGAGVEEVALEDLVVEVLGKLGSFSQDLALIIENWSDVDARSRREILRLLKYPAELLAYLETR